MKKLFLSLLVLLAAVPFTHAQNDAYEPELAEEVGADQYGMKKYVIAFLHRGDRVSEYSDEQRSEIQAGHLANINRMAEDGQLVMAGPFFGNEELRGLYIFAVESLEEAEELTSSDPAIKAGVLKMDLKEWYGSAALMLMNDLHMKVAREVI
ncbi:YciI family protein [Algoriphagus halophytocola]|uniref:YciI family protein n=1 Tax=Algoriphagus halophytocola TaxID=2991499 RepID=A0ABY6MF93_9BACT|nr:MULTISPECIES: YciI family protein [unclassified Algoriphagus]UZD22482.1 YciI family protein [Algoriphagus sp. TR-M5]WBL43742.1 YciI family protein [Algoriphagus sp. TR-M9]